MKTKTNIIMDPEDIIAVKDAEIKNLKNKIIEIEKYIRQLKLLVAGPTYLSILFCEINNILDEIKKESIDKN